MEYHYTSTSSGRQTPPNTHTLCHEVGVLPATPTHRTSSSISSASLLSSSGKTANTSPPDSPLSGSRSARKSFTQIQPVDLNLSLARARLPKPMIQIIPFRKIELVGQGSWSMVSCAWTDFAELKASLDVGLRVIPQVFCIKKPSTKMAARIIYHEAQILTYLSRHTYMTDFVVDFYGMHPEDGSIFMDFICLDLGKLASGDGIVKLDQSHAMAVSSSFVGIVHGLVEGLNFLHSCGVVHADIKPANILIEATPRVACTGSDRRGGFSYKPLYCDFSAAFVPDLESGLPDSAQTWEYMSPELFKADARPTFASDVYALALTLMASLLAGKSPYSVSAIPAVACRDWARQGDPFAVMQAYHPKANARLLSSGLDRVLKDATCKHPDQRITAAQWRSRATAPMID